MSIQKLLAKARAEAAAPATDTATVVVAGEMVELRFTKLIGAEWSALTVVNPPRQGAKLDSNLGYDLHAVSGQYPAEAVAIAGEVASGSEWAEFFGLLDAPWRETVAMKLWGLNQHGPATKILELGKASSGAGSKKKRN